MADSAAVEWTDAELIAAVLNGEKTAAHVTGAGIPKQIVTDGPVVTKDNAEGMLWMEHHFLI